MTAAAPGGPPRGGLTVRGHGAAAAVPDVVVAELGAEVRADDVGAALREATSALAAVRAALREGGVPDADVATGGTATWTEHTGPGPDDLRVVARLGLVVTLRDVAGAGDLVGAALAAGGGAARLDGLRLQVADPSAAQARAREAAWHDAQTTAQHLAGLAGRELGAVLRVRQDEEAATGAARFAVAGASLPPVEAGEQTVRVSLTVRWAWA